LYSQQHIGIKTTPCFIFCLLLAGLLLLLATPPAIAQSPDTLKADTLLHSHSSRKAVIYSLICPGLGQIYNKKYWKLPFIYGGTGAFAYFVGYNHSKYIKFKDAYIAESANTDHSEPIEIDGYLYSYESLPRGRDYYRRYRDLSVLGLGAVYLLTVIDAMVDAHFFYYDVSEDLSMRLQPTLIQNPDMTAAVGLQINLGF
jgi:hypothetical protein